MKRKIQILFLFVVGIINISLSQGIQFAHVYGGTGYDIGFSVIQTMDEGYAVAGSSSSTGNGSSDAYLLKTDSLGAVLWKKTYGGINIDQVHSIEETADSGFVMVGFTNSFGNGGYDLYVIKTDKMGDTIWTKTYGGTNWDFGYSIEKTLDSAFVITGGTYSFGSGSEDMFLIKINRDGDTLWTKTYGGINDEEAREVKQTLDGGFILTGFSKSFGDSNGDIYTIKTNNVGDTLWTNLFGGIQEDAGHDVIEISSGDFMVAGKTSSGGSGASDGITVSISSSGATLGNKYYGGTEDDGLNSIIEAAGGRYGLAGYTYSYGSGSSDFVLYIENPFNGFHSGTYGKADLETAYSINNTKDNGYIICGKSTSYSNFDYIFLVKTDSNGVAPPTAEITITNIPTIIINNNLFNVYPNPANQQIVLNLNDNKAFQKNPTVVISIMDIWGRIVFQQTILISDFEAPFIINANNFTDGVYTINFSMEDFYENEKLIIQH